MKYLLEEQETIISFDAVTKLWVFETNYAPHIKKVFKNFDRSELTILGETIDNGNTTYLRVAFDPDKVTFKPFPKKKRELTEEQKAQLVKQLKGGKK